LSGGTISNTQDAGAVTVDGTAIATVVNNGGEVSVNVGGIAIDTIVSGGDQFVYGAASKTVIDSGGAQFVYGTANATTVNGGGDQFVYGVAIGTTLNAGTEFVYGLANATTVSSGGVQQIDGVATGTTIDNGGVQDVAAGATTTSTTIDSGGTEIVSAGGSANGTTVSSGGTLDVLTGGTAINPHLFSGGTIRNAGTLLAASGTTVLAGVVTGGTTLIGNGTVDIQHASSENITFQLGGTGGLELDVASAYTGKVSGFGKGGNTSEYIDLTNVASNGNVHRSYSGNTTSGVLTVTSGATVVAKIAMVGNYTTASFKLGADSSGHVQITDPSISASNTASSSIVTSGGSNGASFIDNASTFSGTLAGFWAHNHTGLPGIGFGAHTMLGHSEDNGDGGTLPDRDGTHGAKLALLGHYMATSFVTAANGHGGTLISEAAQAANQLVSLTTPHTG
jgi:autotransporter passenger strand-loop-strand repeat protein